MYAHSAIRSLQVSRSSSAQADALRSSRINMALNNSHINKKKELSVRQFFFYAVYDKIYSGGVVQTCWTVPLHHVYEG